MDWIIQQLDQAPDPLKEAKDWRAIAQDLVEAANSLDVALFEIVNEMHENERKYDGSR
jgi:hypothetical protein